MSHPAKQGFQREDKPYCRIVEAVAAKPFILILHD
jgi:hypothetical protein